MTRAEIVAAHVANAKTWIRWLYENCPTVAICCPWLPLVELIGDQGGDHREDGLRKCEAMASRCDGIFLVGGSLRDGMRRERTATEFGATKRRGVVDLLHLGPFPPLRLPDGLPWPFVRGMREVVTCGS